MKILFALSFLFSISALADTEILLNLETANGHKAFIVGEKINQLSPGENPSFQRLRAVIGGKSYRISNQSHPRLLNVLCDPFKDQNPFVYQSAESKGFFDKVVFIDSNLRVLEAKSSEAQIVMSAVVCMKERY